MAVLRNGSKYSHTTCMLRFFTVSRLALNPNLILEIGPKVLFGMASTIFSIHLPEESCSIDRADLIYGPHL